MGSPASHLMNLVSLRRSLLYSALRRLSSNAVATSSDSCPPTSFTPPSETAEKKDDRIYVKRPNSSSSSSSVTRDEVSVTMPMTFMTGSVVGKRFYKEVTTRMADDGNGWTVMLDYRTLKTPYKRPLKLPNLALAKAIAAEWEYQQTDGIRPFTMPLMKLACTAIERVPLTRVKIIKNLIDKFHHDLVFCRSPGDTDLTKGVRENVLQKTTDCELAAIDAIAASAHSLVIALAILRERLNIEETMELIRLEEDLQVDKWGLVEGGHDVDIADLQVQISSAVVFLRMSFRQ
ncbi:ATP synthase mitochondrial F1 complex assembly factor 2 isoform X2 [Dendrobium catenatum]|uniref:ATP synthase mitochondrial F1 complex assembly factor 2 isoform X2 n=1 Tax=Dendrobium catenatum TaxID=906689 RepID=UPI0009F5A96F|nr:ATP synthase mitochondrial F1 complex assembly factor 2 isoform X2 [Dendrobium catenatum]